jgi:hypothetical protein
MSTCPTDPIKKASTALHSLERKELVAHSARESIRPALEFRLTIGGLINALDVYLTDPRTETVGNLDKKASNEFSKIAAHWAHLLPGILDKWRLFVDAGCEIEARQRLLYACKGWFSFVSSCEMLENLPSPEDSLNMSVVGSLNRSVNSALVMKNEFYGPAAGISDNLMLHFLHERSLRPVYQAVIDDSEMNEFITAILDYELHELKEYQTSIEQMKRDLPAATLLSLDQEERIWNEQVDIMKRSYG